MSGWLNAVIAIALIGGGWWAIVDLLDQSLCHDDDRTPIRRSLPANRVLDRVPRSSGAINRSRPPSIQMSDLSQ